MTDLIKRLEEAAEGSRRLSDEVLLACGWELFYDYADRRKVPYDWKTPDGRIVGYGEQPDPATSIDDALTLIPEGWALTNMRAIKDHFCVCLDNKPECTVVCGSGKTIALAICAAALRAREVMK